MDFVVIMAYSANINALEKQIDAVKGKTSLDNVVIGLATYNQTMVNVTDIPDVVPGDEVVLVGRQGSEQITPEEIAGYLGTINYEVPSLFTRRVPRVYIR